MTTNRETEITSRLQLPAGLAALWENVSPECRLLSAIILQAKRDLRARIIYNYDNGRPISKHRAEQVRNDAREFLDWANEAIFG